MSKEQRVDHGRWDFRKGSADAVGQFGEQTVVFFKEGRRVPIDILTNNTPRFLTAGLTKCRVLTKPKVAVTLTRAKPSELRYCQ